MLSFAPRPNPLSIIHARRIEQDGHGCNPGPELTCLGVIRYLQKLYNFHPNIMAFLKLTSAVHWHSIYTGDLGSLSCRKAQVNRDAHRVTRILTASLWPGLLEEVSVKRCSASPKV